MTVLHVITLSFKSSVREGMQDVMIATTIYALFVSHISSDEKAEGRKSKTAQKHLQLKKGKIIQRKFAKIEMECL